MSKLYSNACADLYIRLEKMRKGPKEGALPMGCWAWDRCLWRQSFAAVQKNKGGMIPVSVACF